VRFGKLPREVIERIVAKALDDFRAQLSEKRVTLEATEACVKRLAELGYSDEFGARNVGRVVEEKIKSWFVDEVLFGGLKDGGAALADVEDGGIVIKTL